jgi:hypothetical protein
LGDAEDHQADGHRRASRQHRPVVPVRPHVAQRPGEQPARRTHALFYTPRVATGTREPRIQGDDIGRAQPLEIVHRHAGALQGTVPLVTTRHGVCVGQSMAPLVSQHRHASRDFSRMAASLCPFSRA